MDTFEMLEELLEQDQFELLPSKECDTERRLVYLMNDAVESFLVFRGAALTGHYLEDYEGALTWSISRDATRYVLVVWQGDNAVTLLFEKLDLEAHLYNYGKIAHFWVPGYEYLRQLEYRIAILRDKGEYLGMEYCTPMERRLAHLAYFPPLNTAVIRQSRRNTSCRFRIPGTLRRMRWMSWRSWRGSAAIKSWAKDWPFTGSAPGPFWQNGLRPCSIA